jgi:hypothetical protein
MNTLETLISPDLKRFYDICDQHGWKQEKIDAAARVVDLREKPADWTIEKKRPLFKHVLEYYPFSDIQLALDALEALGKIGELKAGQTHMNIEQLMINDSGNVDNSYVARIAELQRIQLAIKKYDNFVKLCEISHTIHEPRTERRGNRLHSIVHPLHTMGKQIEAYENSEELNNHIRLLQTILEAIQQHLHPTIKKDDSAEGIQAEKEVTMHTSWEQLVHTLQSITTVSDECAEIFKSSNAEVLKLVKGFLEKFTELQTMIAVNSKDVVLIENIFPSFSNSEDKRRRNEILSEIHTIRNLLDSPTKFIVAVKAHLHNYETEKRSITEYLPPAPQVVQNIARNTLVQIMSVIVAIGSVSVSYKALTSSRSTDTTPAVAKNDVTPKEPAKKSNTAEPVSAEETAEKERKMAQFQAMAADLQDSLQKSQAQAPKTEEVAASTEPDPLDDLFAARTGYNPNESSPAQKEKTANATPEQAATTTDSNRLAHNEPATKEPVQAVAKSAANLPGITLSAPAADISAAEVTTTQSAAKLPPVASDAEMISPAPKPGTQIADTEPTTSTYEDIFDNEPKTEAENKRAEANKRRYEQIEAAEKAAQAKRAEVEKEKTERLAQNDAGKIKEPTKSAANLPPITLSKPAADISAAEVATSQSTAKLPPVASDADMISPAPKPGAMIIEEAELTELMKNRSSTDTQKDTVQPPIAQTRIAERLATATLEPARVEVTRTPSKITTHSALNIPVPEVHISSAVIAKATFEPKLPEITDHKPLPRRTFTLPEIKHTVITVPKAKTPDTVTANNPKDSSTTNTTQNTTAEKPSIDIKKITDEQFMLLSTEEQNKVLEQMRKLPKVQQRK